VAIPLATLTAGRVTSLHDLMDSAYDAPEIAQRSHALGHVPIIDKGPKERIRQGRDGGRSSRQSNRGLHI
jgi:hypothetical protein